MLTDAEIIWFLIQQFMRMCCCWLVDLFTSLHRSKINWYVLDSDTFKPVSTFTSYAKKKGKWMQQSQQP